MVPVRRDRLEALTDDPRYGHELAGVSPDGGTVAYLSNRRNGIDFDLWACDLATGTHRSVYAEGGWCQPSSGFSPDGRWVSMSRPGPRPLDEDLVLVEVATGETRIVLSHPAEAAEVGPSVWWDDTTIFVSSNVSRDRSAVVRYDLSTGETVVPGPEAIGTLRPSRRSRAAQLVAVENRNGSSRVVLVDPTGAARKGRCHLPSPALSCRTRSPARAYLPTAPACTTR